MTQSTSNLQYFLAISKENMLEEMSDSLLMYNLMGANIFETTKEWESKGVKTCEKEYISNYWFLGRYMSMRWSVFDWMRVRFLIGKYKGLASLIWRENYKVWDSIWWIIPILVVMFNIP